MKFFNLSLIIIFVMGTTFLAQKSNEIIGILIPKGETKACLWVPETDNTTHIKEGNIYYAVEAGSPNEAKLSNIIEIRVKRQYSTPCTFADGMVLKGLGFEVQLLKGKITDKNQYLVLRDPTSTARFHFEKCYSTEGIHLYATNKIDSSDSKKMIWHQYLFLGYSVEPTCSERILNRLN